MCRGHDGRYWIYDDKQVTEWRGEVGGVKPTQVHLLAYVRADGGAAWAGLGADAAAGGGGGGLGVEEAGAPVAGQGGPGREWAARGSGGAQGLRALKARINVNDLRETFERLKRSEAVFGLKSKECLCSVAWMLSPGMA